MLSAGIQPQVWMGVLPPPALLQTPLIKLAPHQARLSGPPVGLPAVPPAQQAVLPVVLPVPTAQPVVPPEARPTPTPNLSFLRMQVRNTTPSSSTT